ncbi:MAG TPA: carboxymuconolactone decarboxylase family protein [Polyangiaceae bacterium]|nr:carboxymuconolactone decarboxylase family protein [Polyangiaceae bacterium]
MARIPYAPQENPGADHPMNLFRMLAHSKPVSKGFAKLGTALLSECKLDSKLREMAILRVGLRARAAYEVGKHLEIGRLVGLSEAQLEALHPGADQETLGETGRAVLALADELFTQVRASDETLEGVRRHLGDQETVELVVTIGYYGMVCRVLETLGVDIEK